LYFDLFRETMKTSGLEGLLAKWASAIADGDFSHQERKGHKDKIASFVALATLV
jgi:hypothetical protein